jgi:hypothetical protein
MTEEAIGQWLETLTNEEQETLRGMAIVPGMQLLAIGGRLHELELLDGELGYLTELGMEIGKALHERRRGAA